MRQMTFSWLLNMPPAIWILLGAFGFLLICLGFKHAKELKDVKEDSGITVAVIIYVGLSLIGFSAVIGNIEYLIELVKP